MGGAALWPGVGFFIGQSGDNQAHEHWAHQLVIGLEGLVEVGFIDVATSAANESLMQAPAIFIRAGARHRLSVGTLISVFLDPMTELSQALCHRLEGCNAVCELPPDLASLFRDNLTGNISIGEALARIEANLVPRGKGRKKADERLQRVMAALALGDPLADGMDRRRLAALAGLSETRFSHWFREQTGMPLRSYRKWLRLVYGAQLVLQGQAMTTAAHEANFSDQAHFSRSFLQMLGVQPSQFLGRIRLLTRPEDGQHPPERGVSFFDPGSFPY